MKTTASTLAAVLATAASFVSVADACGTESEFAVVRRDAIQRRQAAAAARPTDEAGMAQLTDSAQECAVYSYPPVAALVSLGFSLSSPPLASTSDTEQRRQTLAACHRGGSREY